MSKGILVVGHGSRSKEAAEVFAVLVKKFRDRGYEHVKGGNMELAAPTIEDAVGEFKEEGIFDIIVLPLFLYTGMHIKKDIPSMLEGYQKDEPRLKFTMARPMEDDDLIVDIMVKRYEELNNQ